ncbi:MAG: aminotransferase class V-fold PLP-dependent enzyme [Coriobacteriia bacterium]|nr:aminotransferase class V-fold PLP-dependent enzyme [Coriobacteriia bacterium]
MPDFIYLDQAATSWPKPQAVADTMLDALNIPGSPSRSAHIGARRAEQLLTQSRKTAAAFLGVKNPHNLIFVPGATFGLNVVLRGAYQQFSNTRNKNIVSENAKNAKKDVSTSGATAAIASIAYSGGEHNAVTRTLAECVQAQKSVQDLNRNQVKTEAETEIEAEAKAEARNSQALIEIPLESNGRLCLRRTEEILKDTRPFAFVCQHASNVTGIINPIEKIAQVCSRLDIALIVDASQTAGHLPMQLDDLAQIGMSAWVCPGHKGLMGPAGSGLVYLAENFKPRPLVTGGTGSGEHFIDYGDECDTIERPADYEAGTLALPAIAGLAAGISCIAESFEEDSCYVNGLTEQMLNGLASIKGIQILGLPCADGKEDIQAQGNSHSSYRLPLVSIVADDIPSSELAFLLDARYIAARAEFHCAPLTHRYLNTYPDGALRLSWNVSNAPREIEAAIAAIKEIVNCKSRDSYVHD